MRMSSMILMRRVGGGLFPAEARASDLVRKIAPRGCVAVRVMRSRSARQSAFYWRVLEEVVAATGRWRTPEELHMALKVPRAFCARLDVPRDVRLVLQPFGGRLDYSALFHQAGHAEPAGQKRVSRQG